MLIESYMRLLRYVFCIFFFSFHPNKIHPVTNYKAIKNKINKTRQHRAKKFFSTNKTTTTTKKNNNNKKEKEMKLLAPASLPFCFERRISQSYDQ